MKIEMKLYATFLLIVLSLMPGCAHKKDAQGGDSLKEVTQGYDSVSMPLPENKKPAEDVYNSVHKTRDLVVDYFTPLSGEVAGFEVEHAGDRPGEEMDDKNGMQFRSLTLDDLQSLNADIKDDQDGHVLVRLEEGTDMKKGMRLSVFRKGEPFYHPVTDELLGNAEDYVGRIEVKEGNVEDRLYVCAIIDGDVRTGDKVRISSSKIKLAFFQDRKANWSLSEAFYGSLKGSGRFEISDAYAPDYNPDTLSKHARDLGAEAVLLFSTPVKDRERNMNIKLYWAVDGKEFGEINEAVQHVADTIMPEEEFISSSFRDTEPWRKFLLQGGQLISMGDVDGDGVNELVVSDGRSIRIYSLKEDIQELWRVNTKDAGTHVSLDTLDVNMNGRAEIFVTSVANPNIMNVSDNIDVDDSQTYRVGMSVTSFVVEYDPSEGYKTLEENIPYFLRTSGKTLLMQSFHENRIFDGPVYRGEWKDMHYVPDSPFELPEIANIYGFTFIDWSNEGNVDLMTYGDDGYLYLYDHDGNLKWKSDESLGPFSFTFESSSGVALRPVVKWSVRGRLEIVRTERGLEVVAVSRKPVLKAMPGLGAYKADVYSLWWDGSYMDKELVLNDVSGAITDYLIQGRELFLIAKNSLFSYIGSLAKGDFAGRSILYYYNFAPLETLP